MIGGGPTGVCGSTRTTVAFGKRYQAVGVKPLTGSVGDCFGSAMTESFFATLACERLDRRRFKTQQDARMAVFDFSEGFYNLRRRHSGLGNLSLNYC